MPQDRPDCADCGEFGGQVLRPSRAPFVGTGWRFQGTGKVGQDLPLVIATSRVGRRPLPKGLREVGMKHSVRWSRPRTFLLACCVGPALAGCATTGLPGSNTALYRDASDPCSSYRQPLVATSESLSKSIWTGAAIGTIAGAILGSVAGDRNTALLGAAAGAAAGASLGYLEGKRKQTQTREDLLAAIDTDAESDSQQVRAVTTAIENLGLCRQRQIDRVRAQFGDGVITEGQALQQADAIQVAIDTDNSLIDDVLGQVDTRYKTYVDAKSEVLEAEPTQVGLSTQEAKAVAASHQSFNLKPASGTYTIKVGANVRSGPSVSSPKVGSLAAGQDIQVTGVTDDEQWYAFLYDGKTALVYHTVLESADTATEQAPIKELAVERQVAQATRDRENQLVQNRMDALRALLPA